MSEKTVKVNCYRSCPETGEEPRYDTFEVPLAGEMSVMDALAYIYENRDRTLGYFSCCNRGLCARCTVRIDGRPGLSCQVPVTGDITVEPVNKERVIRDLLVE